MKRLILVLAALTLAQPAAAQFSESYNFLKAIRDRDGLKAQEFVQKPGSVMIDTRDSTTGETALHIVTRARDLPWMRLLLIDWKAKPDMVDRRGNSALLIAAELGFVEGADLLLKRRAQVNLANRAGETALILAVQRRDAAMTRLLMANGANPDKVDSSAGLSARDYATRDRRAAAVLKIIEDAKTVRPAAGPKL